MNGKLIHNFDPLNIVLKPPVGSFSEIWYLDKTGEKTIAVRPIFKTPRLPLKFGAKQYTQDTTYGYCLNMSNKDIDPEIADFFQLIKQLDRSFINSFTENHKSWPVKPTSCMKYRSAMKRKTVNDDFYFQIKLIHKANDVATVIYDSNKNKVGPEDITYGKYADQFICPAYLYYDEKGIHPVWQAHQIVLSSVERIFLEECILDHIFKPSNVPLQTYIQPLQHQQVPQQLQHHQLPLQLQLPNPPPPVRLTINPMELKNVLQNLKRRDIKQEDEDD